MQIQARSYTGRSMANPRPLGWLVSDPRASGLWLLVRLYVGWEWLDAGRHKLAGSSSVGWVHGGMAGGKSVHAGDKLLAFWRHAVAPSQGGPPQIAFGWYRAFLQFLIAHHTQGWFAQLIAFGEFFVGLTLLLGAFTAVAASGGALLDFNYMLAGSASLNPVLFLGALLLLSAWRIAGYIGLDRWLLPLVGTPWQPGWLFRPGHADTCERRPRPAATPRRMEPAGRQRPVYMRRRRLV